MLAARRVKRTRDVDIDKLLDGESTATAGTGESSGGPACCQGSHLESAGESLRPTAVHRSRSVVDAEERSTEPEAICEAVGVAVETPRGVEAENRVEGDQALEPQAGIASPVAGLGAGEDPGAVRVGPGGAQLEKGDELHLDHPEAHSGEGVGADQVLEAAEHVAVAAKLV